MFPSHDQLRIKRLEAIQQAIARSRRIERVRMAAVAREEIAHLAIATALLDLKHSLDLPWRDLPNLLQLGIDAGTLHRVAMRKLSISPYRYRFLTSAINSFEKKTGRKITQFPVWLVPTLDEQ